MSIDWDRYASDRHRFENVGDVARGYVGRIYEGEDQKKRPYPILEVGDLELHATQTDLKTRLAEVRPEAGGFIKVTFVAVKNTGQPQPMKVFKVEYATPQEMEERKAKSSDAAAAPSSPVASDESGGAPASSSPPGDGSSLAVDAPPGVLCAIADCGKSADGSDGYCTDHEPL